MRARVLVPLAVAAAVAIGWAAWPAASGAAGSSASAGVPTTRVVRGDLVLEVHLDGELRAGVPLEGAPRLRLPDEMPELREQLRRSGARPFERLDAAEPLQHRVCLVHVVTIGDGEVVNVSAL